ncbi:MAG: HTH-type transcriptional activator IlvY [Halioglobus sp.]|nr:HTH-type transcriptional activator IlvY [Halioglobus sp.]
METRSLQVFLSVAETLSFSRSAERLHLSVSAVSRTVRRLEEEVGQPLLERDRRRVRLTGAGREFREYARGALAQWHQLRRRLDSRGDVAGEISLFCSVTASYSVLAPVLEAFRGAYPAVEIMLHTGDQADGIRRVFDGQDDMAVSGRPHRLPAGLAFLPLRQSPLRFWAPAADCAVRDLAMSAGRSGQRVDWQQVPFIVPERGATKEMLDHWLAERGVRPQIYAQVAGHEAIVAMVGLGLGIGVAPQLVAEASGMRDRVSRLPVEPSLPPLTIGLCTLSKRLASPCVRALWDVAGQTYGKAL